MKTNATCFVMEIMFYQMCWSNSALQVLFMSTLKLEGCAIRKILSKIVLLIQKRYVQLVLKHSFFH
jgi:hypothetical protein